MEKKTARLTNSITSTAFRSFNKWGGVTYEDILSNYSADLIDKCWMTLSRSVIENYQAGRGTFIKGLGTFTFTNVEYSLEGTTNQYERDVKKRRPIFIVSPEFVDYLRPGQFTTKSGLIYYTQKINNSISICKVNYATLSYGVNISKEEYVTIVSTVIKNMGDQIRRGVFREKYMPGLGALMIRGNVFGMRFDGDTYENNKLQSQRLIQTKKNIQLCMETSQSSGVRQRDIKDIDKAIRDIRPSTAVLTHISPSGEQWLRNSLNIDIRDIQEEPRGDLLIEKPKENKEYLVDQRYYRDYPKQELRGLKVSQELLEAISKKKNLIIREMKKYDHHGDGIITKFDFICAFRDANPHFRIGSELITKIVELYVNNTAENLVNYTLLMKAICDDINTIVSKEYRNFPIEKYKYSINAENKRAVSAYAFSRHSGNLANQAANALDNYNSMGEISEEEIKKDINRIKQIVGYMTIRSINKMISYLELISILQGYSISIQKLQMLKVLKFLKISNPNAFSLIDFLKRVKATSFIKPSFKVTQKEIDRCILNIRRALSSLGGIDYLFKENDTLSYDDFLNRISPHIKDSVKVLHAVFDFISNSSSTLSKSQYYSHLRTEEESAEYNNDFDIKAMTNIRNKMYSLDMKSDAYFNHLLSYNICRYENAFTLEEFERLLQLEKYSYTLQDIRNIFRYIDFKRDGIIDREEWNRTINKIPHPITTMQNYIRDHKMTIEELAYKMSIDILCNRDINSILNQRIDKNQFKMKMKSVNDGFDNEFIFSLFDSIAYNTNTQNYISIGAIFDVFNIYRSDTYMSIDPSSICNEVISKFQSTIDFKSLISKCQQFDKAIKGKMPLSTFLNVIHSVMGNKITDENLNRFIRIHRKVDSYDNVYYHELIGIIYADCKENTFLKCVEHLRKYLKDDCNNDLFLFFVKMNNMDNGHGMKKYVAIEKLYEFFRNNVDMLQEKTMYEFDIDGDGVVSFDDMKKVITTYIDKGFFDNKKQIIKDNKEKSDKITFENYKKIVNLIHVAIKKVNMTEVNLFQFLDADQDSFVSQKEFSYQINQLPLTTKLTQQQIDSFFAYLDVYHANKINIETFLSQLRKFNDSKENLYKGNFIIENLLLSEFAKFYLRNNSLCDTELFALLDSDHDGVVSCSDIKKFALNTLLLSKNELNDTKIRHVMNAISLTKNGSVTLADIRYLMEKINANDLDEYFQNIRQMCNIGVTKMNKDKFWITEIVDKFGMFISEMYNNNIEEFFKDNFDRSEIDIKTFKIFLDKNYKLLSGYSVTAKEIDVIFNTFSNGKKTINKNDFDRVLNKTNDVKYDFYAQMHYDVYNFINLNFEKSQDAFKYFKKVSPLSNKTPTSTFNKTFTGGFNNYITETEFFNGINYLFPNKYSTNTVLNYINKIFPNCKNNNMRIPYSEFTCVYYEKFQFDSVFNKTMANPSKILTNRPVSSMPLMTFNSPFITKEHPPLKTPYDLDPLEKVKRLILSSKYDFKNKFKENIMLSGNGLANQFEFRNMIKQLNLGLTNIEIEDIISHSGMSRDGYINLIDFYKYITNEDQNLKISKENVLAQLKEIKQLIYKYYTNPKLAFELNDKEIKQQIDFDKFKRIIYDIYKREVKKVPNYPMMKYLYDFIDIRKDGIIDINEWNKVFAISEGSLDIKASKEKLKILREWETSNDISSIYKMIARNKKAIKDKVKLFTMGRSGVNGNGMVIQSDNLVDILKNVLGRIRLSNTQWKMLVAIGDRDKSGLVDFDMFMSVIETSAKMERSHPLPKFK